jgi:membrane-bound lytic murein transglycosylase MltF
MRRLIVSLAAGLLLCPAVAGCTLQVPTDPDGTLDQVRSSGVLRAGASPSPGRVEIDGDVPSGPEVSLVEGFADSVGAEVEWTVAGEEHLVSLLEDGSLDVAVGGFSDQNPWVARVALTRPYADTRVLMAPMGENELLSELERWLDAHAAGVPG